MQTQLQVFKALSRAHQIAYFDGFYQSMIQKTDNPDYKDIFQAKLREIHGYTQNAESLEKLTELYRRILEAKENSQAERTQAYAQQLEARQAQIQAFEGAEIGQDADEYLAQKLAQI